MSRLCRLLVCNLLLAWFLTGCSTPGNRARDHAAAWHRLSPSDQQLVLHGHVRPGMNPDAVYIAWGDPDEKRLGGGGKSSSEVWIYRQRVTLYEPINSYSYRGPYHGFGNEMAGRGLLPAYAYGGVGYEGALRSQPHVRSLDSVRVAEFSGGTVDRYKDADGNWSHPRRSVAATRRGPAVSLTARHVERKMPHLARHTAKSSVASSKSGLAFHRAGLPTVRHVAGGDHRKQLAGKTAKKKRSGLRTVSVHGSKAGSKRSGTAGPHAGHRVHPVGHAHPGSPEKHRPRAA